VSAARVVPATAEAIAQAARLIRHGGLVAFPTETVYGLGADALDPRSVARVYATKGRPAFNPLIVHVADTPMARAVTARWPDAADRLVQRFWPGPLSIVLPKLDSVPDIVTGGGPNVAVRCPDHPLALELIRRFGRPLVGPSANRSGGVSPTTAQHVTEAFTPEEVHVVDGGACEKGIESTVVSLAGERPIVLRPGLISPDEIGEVLGESVLCVEQSPCISEGGPAALDSPGLLSRHYAPSTPTVMLVPAELGGLLASLASPAIVLAQHAPVPAPHIRIQMPDSPGDYAAAMYAALRNADAARRAMIVVEEPPRGSPGRPNRWIWMAIHDRLRRACRPA